MAAITLIPDESLDLILQDIIDNGETAHLTGEVTPATTYAQVVAMSIGSFAPTITLSDLAAGGRKVRVSAESGLVIDTTTNFAGADKDFDQIVIVDDTNSKIKHVAIGTNETLSDAQIVNVPQYDINIKDMVVVP